jgi:hypothetical protein
MGYYISSHSFAGPFLPLDRIRSGRALIPGPEIANLFCVNKKLLGPGGSMIRTSQGSLTNDVTTRPEVAAAAAAAKAVGGGQLHGAGRRQLQQQQQQLIGSDSALAQ